MNQQLITMNLLTMIIIHGENTSESRKKLDQVLQEKKNIKRFEGKSLKSDAIPLLFESSELFAQEKTIVIENCKGLPKASLDAIVHLPQSPETTLIFWQDGNYDARLIKKFPNAQVFTFPLPKYYFAFLDNLNPGKAAFLHNTYASLLDTFVPEQIFFSMVKRIRHLLVLKLGIVTNAEINKMTEWQRNKLQSQARLWSKQELQIFYNKLYDTEVRMKTSSLPVSLSTHLDNLVLTELQ